MMVVNLYVDHLIAPEDDKRLRPAEEVWYATVQHSALFLHAAKVVGLSRAEFRQFQWALLDGKAVRVKLPHRLDAIVGDRRGHLYAVRNAVVRPRQNAWPTGLRVRLPDGVRVYIPDGSGSLSLVRPHHHRRPATKARASTIVYVQPTPAPPPVFTPALAVVAKPQALCDWWCFGLPLDGMIATLLHFGFPHPSAPPVPVQPVSVQPAPCPSGGAGCSR